MLQWKKMKKEMETLKQNKKKTEKKKDTSKGRNMMIKVKKMTEADRP